VDVAAGPPLGYHRDAAALTAALYPRIRLKIFIAR
jgi:hypothetical protein